MPLGYNFICKSLVNRDLNQNPNRKVGKEEATKSLTKTGQEVVGKFIAENDKKEEILRQNEENLYKYYHSKPPLVLNKWKYANHVIEEFSTPPADLVHAFKKEVPKKPSYMTDPFRRPSDYGDYFDKHIGIL